MKFKGLSEFLSKVETRPINIKVDIKPIEVLGKLEPDAITDHVHDAVGYISKSIEADLYGTDPMTGTKETVDKIMKDLKAKEFDADFMKELEDA